MPIEITEIRLEDHSADVIANLEKQMEVALRAVGETAERYAKEQTPVDTGRLRNSIAYATSRMHSTGSGRDEPQEKPEEGAVYIGSNVEYAA